jgi:hypothetical protein
MSGVGVAERTGGDQGCRGATKVEGRGLRRERCGGEERERGEES